MLSSIYCICMIFPKQIHHMPCWSTLLHNAEKYGGEPRRVIKTEVPSCFFVGLGFWGLVVGFFFYIIEDLGSPFTLKERRLL